jgi:hypothetical protein
MGVRSATETQKFVAHMIDFDALHALKCCADAIVHINSLYIVTGEEICVCRLTLESMSVGAASMFCRGLDLHLISGENHG